MTADIRFYHLTASPLEHALPLLLEKALAAEFRVLVKTASPEQCADLDALLWTYHPNSFLPHGRAQDDYAALQPVLLTTTDENANQADMLVVVDGSTPAEPAAYRRVLDIFDAGDESSLQTARLRWKHYKEAGHQLQYWQQGETGGWTQKA